jgi:pSer/pThr/pTyr-binding forkhead associated (FHA) protein
MNPQLGAFAWAVGLQEPLRLMCTNIESGNISAFEVRVPYAIVGRWPQCAIPLDHPSVSKRHAYLQVVDGQIFFTDLGSRTGLKFDGKPERCGWFPPDAALTIGQMELRHQYGSKAQFEIPFPTANPVSATDGFLALSELSNPKANFVLKQQLTLLGRDKSCNLRIDHPSVSRFHAVIVQAAQHAWLIDLNCGTTLNGRSVRSAALQLGDRIGFKHTSYEVQMERAEVRQLAMNPPMPPPVFFIAPETRSSLEASDSVSAAIGEIRQQTLMMTQVFMKMQQEQMALMKQQMELIQELVAPLKNQPPVIPLVVAESTAESAASPTTQPPPAAWPTTQPPPPPHTAQKPPSILHNEEKAIEEAHFWFMSKTGKKGR